VLTAHKTYELLTQTEVPVILGPVLSQNAAVTAAMLVERDPVMLSPTATEDGVAELGSNIFQMNVTTGVLGRTIAEYAMTNLNINEFALLTPLSDYGRVLSESFKAEVQRRGGTIVVEEFFDEGANDLRPQFTTMRYELLLRRKAKDSLRVVAGETLAPRTAKDDSLLLSDSALSVGGLFIPAEAEDVVMIAPQVHFYKIRTQMLGATGWHSPKTILDGKRYVENAIIVTSAETAREDTLWQAFRTRFQTRFGAEPDRVAALGYDAAKLVCSVLEKLGRSASPDRLMQGLRDVQGYRGVSGQISFDPERGVNREAVIMKISNRRFIRVR
ncbi:MAG: ABC transporter substrate-binding protein, partial [Chitinivibrionales bacterium]|nr:ABC transporter substrate-binding protein [Chitinivibrionales bacterium]